MAGTPVGKSVTLADASHEAAGEKKAVAAGHSAGAGAHARPVAVAHEGHGQINGRRVFVFSQDFTVLGGSLSETHATCSWPAKDGARITIA